jgi:NAD(P)-dependent dehydrogenase (short-subunit alcohol dehydrogenase family)
MTLALNHLSYFLLAILLINTLKANPSSRIINVASKAHERAVINFDDLQYQQGYNGRQAYAQSKLANIMFTYELARRIERQNITVNTLHPGIVATNLWTNNGWIGQLCRRVTNIRSISPEEGAKTIIYLATSPEVENITGKYFIGQKVVQSSKLSYNQTAAKRLWRLSAQMTGLPESPF